MHYDTGYFDVEQKTFNPSTPTTEPSGAWGEMLQVLQDRGITPETEVVTYCTFGNRASQAWFALRYLFGYHDVRVCYASWAEWGKGADTPIETRSGFHAL